jgi:hypothetical protein
VNNRVRIKLAGCLVSDAAPTDCRDVAVLGENERARRNRLGKGNIGACPPERSDAWLVSRSTPTNKSLRSTGLPGREQHAWAL